MGGQGRTIGDLPRDCELCGAIQRLEKRGARFEEQLAIITGLWTQERVSFKGAYYTVDGRLEPKPVTKPHPPVWIGGWGEITLKRAATLADNWIPGPTADLSRLLAGKKIPEFGPGYTVRVNVRIKEGERERVQAYEGVCIGRSGGGLQENFTVRKISFGEGVERVFPLFSPTVDSIDVVRRGKVRRAKLYYLRDRRGKSARIS